MAAINSNSSIITALPTTLPSFAANTASKAAPSSSAMPSFDPPTTQPKSGPQPIQKVSSKVHQFLQECAILEAKTLNAQTKSNNAQNSKQNNAVTVPTATLTTKKVGRFNVKSIIDFINRVDQELLVQAGEEANEESYLSSTFSLVQVLIAILNGSSDKILTELGLSEEDLPSINDAAKFVTEVTCTKESTQPFIQSFNALATSFPVGSTYKETMQKTLDMEVFSLNANSCLMERAVSLVTGPTAAPQLDRAAAKSTVVEWIGSKVNDASLKPAICDAARQLLSKTAANAYLINIFYVSLLWQEEFTHESKNHYFRWLNGDSTTASFMHLYHKHFGVVFAEDYRAIVLDYKVGNDYSRKLTDVIVIPNDPLKLNALSRNMTSIFKDIFKNKKYRKVHLVFPEHAFNYEINYLEKLKKLGISFEGDLSRMSSEKASLKSLTGHVVGSKDKKGTRFVAATFGGALKCGRDYSLPFSINVNRPFIASTFTSHNYGNDNLPLLTTRVVNNQFIVPGEDKPVVKQNAYCVESLDVEAFQKEHGADWDALHEAVSKTADLDDDPQSAQVYTTDNNTKLYVVNFTDHKFSFNRYREPMFKGQLLHEETESDNIPKESLTFTTNRYYAVSGFSPDPCLVFVYEKDGHVCYRDKDLGKPVTASYYQIDEGQAGDVPILFKKG